MLCGSCNCDENLAKSGTIDQMSIVLFNNIHVPDKIF